MIKVRMDRKEMRELTNELENLVYKKRRTAKETQRLMEFRYILGFKESVKIHNNKFNIKEYIAIKKRSPYLNDSEIAKILGVSLTAVAKGKRKHGVQSSDFKQQKTS